MSLTACRVSPVRAVVLNVASLEDAKRFYRHALGMDCLGEVDEVDAAARELWGMGAGPTRMACMGRPEDPYGRVELVQREGCPAGPARDPGRARAPGILTLNLRTADIRKALRHMESHGATALSGPVRHPYRPDAFLHEAVAIGPDQERYTLLQIGDAKPSAGHPVGDVVATVGIVVPDSAAAAAFYARELGMSKVFEMDENGDLFAPLLGTAPGFRMRMALYAAGNAWTGKIETIEFSPSWAEAPQPARVDWRRTGYLMISMNTDDPGRLAAALTANGRAVKRASRPVERPFAGSTRPLIAAAPGGVVIEFLPAPGAPS